MFNDLFYIGEVLLGLFLGSWSPCWSYTVICFIWLVLRHMILWNRENLKSCRMTTCNIFSGFQISPLFDGWDYSKKVIKMINEETANLLSLWKYTHKSTTKGTLIRYLVLWACICVFLLLIGNGVFYCLYLCFSISYW